MRLRSSWRGSMVSPTRLVPRSRSGLRGGARACGSASRAAARRPRTDECTRRSLPRAARRCAYCRRATGGGEGGCGGYRGNRRPVRQRADSSSGRLCTWTSRDGTRRPCASCFGAAESRSTASRPLVFDKTSRAPALRSHELLRPASPRLRSTQHDRLETSWKLWATAARRTSQRRSCARSERRAVPARGRQDFSLSGRSRYCGSSEKA